jgi:ubiquinone/menaquinone biosynthesis C-methylase UbiE
VAGVTANFDPLARIYHVLELSSFGVALEQARFAHVDQLAGCQEILLLGDGDGRFLKRLLKVSPTSRVRSIDASAAMLRLASERIKPADRARVTFECADALTVDLPTFAYDGVATIFFLDCFPDDQAAALVGRISNALRPGGTWLFADFAIPERGVRRAMGVALTSALYAFFRLTTRISARRLPDSEAHITRAGLTRVAERSSVFGLLRSAAFRR